MGLRVRGILFDSGGVLVRPIARRWFPGPRFEQIVGAHLPDLSLAALDDALELGMHYLEERHRQPLVTLKEERQLFQNYYRIVIEALGAKDPPSGLTQELARARTDEEQMQPFGEVVGVLERLRSGGLRLGVLSEGWPSLERDYQRLGLRGFFDAFVISAREARLKTDPGLFAVARERMRLRGPDILFVDNWPLYVETAVRLGFQGAVVDRAGDAPHMAGLTYVADLLGVERMVADALGSNR
jgi:putative hydrolase of the HAD superfamily